METTITASARSPHGTAPLACPDEPWRILPVPAHLAAHLAPATWCVYEWTEYRGRFPGADALMVGSALARPVVDDFFVLGFENQLGLTKITPYRDGRPHGPQFHLEVLARKFTTPAASVRFLSAMLADLFALGSALPFVANAPTSRQVRDAFRPPNDLFAFHFFRHHRDMLIRAAQAVLGQPHRVLADESAMVRLHQVRRIEPESMFRMLRSAAGAPAGSGAHLTALERLRPERVWQRIPAETHDTAENRFILAVARAMLTAIQRLERAAWFASPKVSAHDRTRIHEVKEQLTILATDPRFAALEGAARMPGQSRVLQRRDGYREISLLWQVFQRARQPVLEDLEAAIDLGNVADLYEYWVLFALIDEIQALSGVQARLSDTVGEFGHPSRGLRATFAGAGTLHYNRNFKGYSGITLRPDYV